MDFLGKLLSFLVTSAPCSVRKTGVVGPRGQAIYCTQKRNGHSCHRSPAVTVFADSPKKGISSVIARAATSMRNSFGKD